ncbi:MAG: NAD-dependent protein deacylase [Erysipelotrichaceae bacterium]|nr:NAD-dependent protein deacylase [Erysipelotrichaceae bacterium]
MINRLQEALDRANKIVFFSGAGMSTASGIPDFRSATGLYKNVYRAEEMLSHTFYEYKTEEFFEFYKEKMLFPEAKPNYAHEFIAKLQETKDVSVVTQNIDGLHQAAGSKKVYELHGSVLRNYCSRCHKFFDLNYIIHSDGVPKCDHCGATIKPDVVLYEEGLDEEVITGAVRAIASADLLVVCGTSLVVYPAAGFIRYFNGDTLAIINRDATSYDSNCDIVIHDDLVKTFKQLKIRG